MEKEIIELFQPIQAHGETVSELQLRRPTAQECREIRAFPYTLGQDMLPVAALDVAAKYIMRCCAIPESSVNQLCLEDLSKITWLIIGFFMQKEKASTSDVSSSSSPTLSESAST